MTIRSRIGVALHPKSRLFVLILGLVPAALAGMTVAWASSWPGFLWAVFFVMAAGAFLGISLRSPAAGLVVGLVTMYNPYFNYTFLFLTEWEGGRVRAGLSSVLIFLIGVAVASRWVIARSRPTINVPMASAAALFGLFLAIGVFLGALNGNQYTEILAELFPFVEFSAFYAIAVVVLARQDDAVRAIRALVLAGCITAAAEIALYITIGNMFASKWSLFGQNVARLDDFMPSLLLPLSLGMLVYARSSRATTALALQSVILAAAAALTFSRSVWVSVLVSALLIAFWWVLSSKRPIRRVVLLVAIGAIGAALLGDSGSSETSAVPIGSSIRARVSIERLTGDEWRSGIGRVDSFGYVLEQALESPLVGNGLGASFFHPYAGARLPLSSSPNYYLSLAAQLGFPAALYFIWLCWSLFRRGLTVLLQLPAGPVKGVALGVLSSFVSVGVLLTTFPSLLHFPIAAYAGVGMAAVLTIGGILSGPPLEQ